MLSENNERKTKQTFTYHQVHVDSPLEVANWNTQEDSRTMFVSKLICQRKEQKDKEKKKLQHKIIFVLYTKKFFITKHMTLFFFFVNTM
jgi:hypothetical protein